MGEQNKEFLKGLFQKTNLGELLVQGNLERLDTKRGIGKNIRTVAEDINLFDSFPLGNLLAEQAKEKPLTIDRDILSPLYKPMHNSGIGNFEQNGLKAENEGKHMDFYEIVAKSVDDPEKIKIDAEKRKTLLALSPSESLSGLEAQVDILSKIVVALLDKFETIAPEQYQDLVQKMPLEKFKEILDSVGVMSVKTTDESLEEMKKQKQAIRMEQQKYFSRRSQLK